jgi:hypothetical protein
LGGGPPETEADGDLREDQDRDRYEEANVRRQVVQERDLRA